MIFKKLFKHLTYHSRKERICKKIYQRILKRYPNLPVYDRYNGDCILDTYALRIIDVVKYDVKTGNKIVVDRDVDFKLYNKYFERSDLFQSRYYFRRNGKLYNSTDYRIKICSYREEYIKEAFDKYENGD